MDSTSPCTYSSGTKPDRTTLEMCLGAAATSLGMVMSGTGELTTYVFKATQEQCSCNYHCVTILDCNYR